MVYSKKGHFHSWGIEAPPQPEEAILALFETQSTTPFTMGTSKEFFYRALFFVMFLVVLKFLLIEYIPSFFEALFTILIFGVLILALTHYLNKMNKAVKKKGLSAIGLYIFSYVLILMIL